MSLYRNRFVTPVLSAGPSAGSAGDSVDRRKLILFTEAWMVCVAIALAILTIAGLVSPWLLLALTFALSAGDAFETPTWRGSSRASGKRRPGGGFGAQRSRIQQAFLSL
jgi:hypothetical protein